ncbi:UNVERIFIED_CONTAM: hypothetical protein PYX00_003776 [Menopon gallinae]|uniref:Dynein axonemal assembly factor 10 n=1 Tax=Menopon gallinae TaxID=328185 RepID=A0AAW2I2U3_9NEOP
MDKQQIICHSEKSTNFSIYDARWVPCSTKFIVLGSKPRGTGALQIYEISKGEVNIVKDIEKSKAFKCGTFGASSLRERHFATGDFEGRLQVWDLEDLTIPVYSAQGHTDIINGIDGVGGMSIGSGAPEIVTGSRDGSVKIWDTRQKGKPVAMIAAAEGENKRDCWCVAFGNSYNSEERIVCAGYDNGDLKMINLKNMKILFETNLKNGVCGIEFDRKDIPMNKLVATTLESKIHLFDLKTCHPKKGFAVLNEKAHKSTIWTVKHLPQNREIFITTGGTGSLCLWKYNYPEKRVKNDGDGLPIGVVGNLSLLQNMTISTQPISSFDWSPDKQGLGVCTSFDQTVRKNHLNN